MTWEMKVHELQANSATLKSLYRYFPPRNFQTAALLAWIFQHSREAQNRQEAPENLVAILLESLRMLFQLTKFIPGIQSWVCLLSSYNDGGMPWLGSPLLLKRCLLTVIVWWFNGVFLTHRYRLNKAMYYFRRKSSALSFWGFLSFCCLIPRHWLVRAQTHNLADY